MRLIGRDTEKGDTRVMVIWDSPPLALETPPSFPSFAYASFPLYSVGTLPEPAESALACGHRVQTMYKI